MGTLHHFPARPVSPATKHDALELVKAALADLIDTAESTGNLTEMVTAMAFRRGLEFREAVAQ